MFNDIRYRLFIRKIDFKAKIEFVYVMFQLFYDKYTDDLYQ